MALPVTLRSTIEDILSTGPEASVFLVCQELLNRLPKPAKRGTLCPNCGFKIGCHSCICRNCSHRLKESRPYGSRSQGPPEPPPCLENDCKCCGNDVGLNDGYKLACGHVYHRKCLRVWRSTHSRCVDCPDITIPDTSALINI